MFLHLQILFGVLRVQVLRFANVVPFGIAHSALKESFVNGYRIPTNAVVISNLDSVLMDQDLFENPRQFDPSRFLTSSGSLDVPAHFIPFFFGENTCCI